MTTVLVVELVGIHQMYRLCLSDAKVMVTDATEGFVQTTNASLMNVESSMKVLYEDALFGIGESASNLEDPEFLADYRERTSSLALHMLQNVEGAVCVYIAFNKDASYANQYIAYKREGNSYVACGLEDVNQFDETDFARVGWYYETIANGKSGWLRPYYYRPFRKYLFSYTIPMYVEHEFVGLVGLDMDLAYFQRQVSKIHLYDTGYAYLMSPTKDVLYHPDYPEGVAFEELPEDFQTVLTDVTSNRYQVQFRAFNRGPDKIWVTYQTLTNGMRMGVAVKEMEVLAPCYDLIVKCLMVAAFVITLGILNSIIFVQAMTKPLKELTQAAEEMARGKLDTPITYAGVDEFGRLADAFRMMKSKLQQSFSSMTSLAYTDIMTGVNNKGAFERDLEGVFVTCKRNEENFALLVADVNELKVINDNYGHQAGDDLIKGVATELMKIFGKRNTYRVGGDEFGVIIRNEYDTKIQDDLTRLQNALYFFSEAHRSMFHRDVTVAVGYTFFDWEKDTSVDELYKRADAVMYENKKEMKEKQQAAAK